MVYGYITLTAAVYQEYREQYQIHKPQVASDLSGLPDAMPVPGAVSAMPAQGSAQQQGIALGQVVAHHQCTIVRGHAFPSSRWPKMMSSWRRAVLQGQPGPTAASHAGRSLPAGHSGDLAGVLRLGWRIGAPHARESLVETLMGDPMAVACTPGCGPIATIAG